VAIGGHLKQAQCEIHTDSQTVVPLDSGNDDARTTLYDTYVEMVTLTVQRIIPDKDAADDAAQIAWVAALRRSSSLRVSSSFPAWLHRIAVNSALSLLRSERRRRVRDSRFAPPQHIDIAELACLRMTVQRLPPRLRQVVELRSLGYTHKEIAEQLKISTGTSKAFLHRARARLSDLE
jgi:RNA polymerase sigma-70 factor, ECF subfamily